MVALCQRKFGDALIGEWIVVIRNANMFCIFRHNLIYIDKTARKAA